MPDRPRRASPRATAAKSAPPPRAGATDRVTDALAALLPPSDAAPGAFQPAFGRAAALLLERAVLHAGGRPHRLTEVEFYFRGARHHDPFTHGDPLQRAFGHWYFHRTGGVYRGGTYKGLDIAIGGPDATGGVLIRGMIPLDARDAAPLDGPCVCVDHVLRLTGAASIAALVARFDLSIEPAASPGARRSPLYLTLAPPSARAPDVYASPRVGLSMRRGNTAARRWYIAQRYRFLSEPASTRKGRAHLVVALHHAGRALDEVVRITGVARAVAARYIARYEAGRARDAATFGAGELSTDALCELFGACDALLERGTPPPPG